MKCYCREIDADWLFIVEEVPAEMAPNLLAAWFTPEGNGFVKKYQSNGEDNGVTVEDKEAVKRNFARLGPAMFAGVFDWRQVLERLAEVFLEHDIEWSVTGSLSEALLGAEVQPHDLDILVEPDDFFNVKTLFPGQVVEPFVDNKGSWIMRYFGRLCLDGALVDIAADEKTSRRNHTYQRIAWKGYEVWIEPLEERYRVEQLRQRTERIRAIEAFMQKSGRSLP